MMPILAHYPEQFTIPGCTVGIFYYYIAVIYVRNTGRIYGLDIGNKCLYPLVVYLALVVDIVGLFLDIVFELAIRI